MQEIDKNIIIYELGLIPVLNKRIKDMKERLYEYSLIIPLPLLSFEDEEIKVRDSSFEYLSVKRMDNTSYIHRKLKALTKRRNRILEYVNSLEPLECDVLTLLYIDKQDRNSVKNHFKLSHVRFNEIIESGVLNIYKYKQTHRKAKIKREKESYIQDIQSEMKDERKHKRELRYVF